MVVVDTREGSRDLLPFLPDALPSTLDSADVLIPFMGPDGSECNIGIEVKTVRDLVQSAQNGRLSAQLNRMAEDYDTCILCIYGVYTYNSNTGSIRCFNRAGRAKSLGQSWNSIEAFLMTVRLVGAIDVVQFDRIDEVARWIRVVEAWGIKPWVHHRSLRAVSFNPAMVSPVANNIVYRVAAQIPGIGQAKAEAASRLFKTVEELVDAKPSDWERIPGIGPALAAGAWRSLHTT